MHINLRSLIRRRQHVKQQRNISTPQHEIAFHRVQRLHSVILGSRDDNQANMEMPMY